jgi:hypothetical protein
MQERLTTRTLAAVQAAALDFVGWLDRYGESSYDHQSFFAGPAGRRAKALYYRHRALGTLAVAPMIACEALVPSARRLFFHKLRFPIADAHYAMGFFMLGRHTGDERHYRRGLHFLGVLEATRSPGFVHHGWGYPFDWVTQKGTMPAGTPLITTAPYVYEAFEAAWSVDGDRRWLSMMLSIAEHAYRDIPEVELAPGVSTAAYNPVDRHAHVVNASAYRAYLLASAARRFSRDDFREAAGRNLNYVLRSQLPDGSWPYATDGVRTFVDHFHTCFVLKALAKIERIAPDPRCRRAIDDGVGFYVRRLFDDEGLPRPFAVAPRLTVYRQELYDYAECLNLGMLLRGRYAPLDERFASALADLMQRWRKPDGSFRSRRLVLGWDEVPMHRWALAQTFRSLCQILVLAPASSAAIEPALTGSAHDALPSAAAAFHASF